MANPTCKLNQAQLLQLRHTYELGQYTSLTDLASQFGIKVHALWARIKRQNWQDGRNKLVQKSDKIVEKLVETESKRWTDKVKERTEKDWNIIDRSIDNIGSEVDPDTMLTSVRARKLLDDMHRRSLGMLEPAQLLDIQSKGQSIGESLVSAIAKLRQEKSAVQVTMEQADQLAEYEIVKTVNGKPVS